MLPISKSSFSFHLFFFLSDYHALPSLPFILIHPHLFLFTKSPFNLLFIIPTLFLLFLPIQPSLSPVITLSHSFRSFISILTSSPFTPSPFSSLLIFGRSFSHFLPFLPIPLFYLFSDYHSLPFILLHLHLTPPHSIPISSHLSSDHSSLFLPAPPCFHCHSSSLSSLFFTSTL